MSKFEKRLRKLSRNTTNAVVLGSAFGNLEQILPVYNTVFIIGIDQPLTKAKNLIYKENFNRLENITEVGAIFFDLVNINQLENLKEFWRRNNSVVFIEGDEPISREFSKPLYDTGWECTSLHGSFHIWEQKK